MSTPINYQGLTVAELARMAHDVHVGRREPGHSEEVHFSTCEHPSCVAIREAMNRPKVQP